MAECILTDVTLRVKGRVGMIQCPGDLRVNGEHVTFVTGMRGALLMIINEHRQTMHCSHCSNLVLDDPIVTICADRNPCRCPCHKLLTALGVRHGKVFLTAVSRLHRWCGTPQQQMCSEPLHNGNETRCCDNALQSKLWRPCRILQYGEKLQEMPWDNLEYWHGARASNKVCSQQSSRPNFLT